MKCFAQGHNITDLRIETAISWSCVQHSKHWANTMCLYKLCLLRTWLWTPPLSPFHFSLTIFKSYNGLGHTLNPAPWVNPLAVKLAKYSACVLCSDQLKQASYTCPSMWFWRNSQITGIWKLQENARFNLRQHESELQSSKCKRVKLTRGVRQRSKVRKATLLLPQPAGTAPKAPPPIHMTCDTTTLEWMTLCSCTVFQLPAD